MHIALQGCLRSRDVRYGLTPDTGGHIKFLLELARAAEDDPGVARQEIVTRLFEEPALGADYARRFEPVSDATRIVRIEGTDRAYLAKEVMHFQNPAMANDLERHIRSLPAPPDIIHAHYADAGWIAAEMKKRLGIPYVFTGHSLGAVKHAVMGSAAPALTRRIAIEERAIDRADRVIVSSFDEAEYQYGLYHAARPERIRVNPPGCDLDALAMPDPAAGFESGHIEYALKDPSKRPILALARPVAKKNLAGLVRAFGEDEGLRRKANLIIYAGTRARIADEDEEPARVLSELVHLIDEYDLAGQISMPKRHEPADVAHIYAYAAARRGVFVNTALNEPFGLTLLEAAAAGLPVVATNSGGPTDIVGRLENGLLVEPTDIKATARAIGTLLDDDARHAAMAARGLARVRHYAWPRHAADYVCDLRAVLKPAPSAPSGPRPTTLLVCDLDETLTGCRDGLARLKRWLAENRQVAFAISTGRSIHKAEEMLRRCAAPVPDVLITSAGSEIYRTGGGDYRSLSGDPSWARHADVDWLPKLVDAALDPLPHLRRQPPGEQRRFKRSWFAAGARHLDAVRAALDRAGLDVEIVHTPDRYLDILPKGVTKGHAVLHVASQLGLPLDRVFAAGRSRNDLDMLSKAGRAIIVADHAPELSPLTGRRGTYVARTRHAGGVVEGMMRAGTRSGTAQTADARTAEAKR